MTIHVTDVYGIAYADTDTPLLDVAEVTRQAAITTETALLRGGVVPPAAADLNALTARVVALQLVGQVNSTSNSGALGATPLDVPGTALTFTASMAGTLLVTATFDFQLNVSSDLMAGYLNVDGADRAQAAVFGGVSRGAVSRSWAVPLTTGAHPLKLRAARVSGTGTADATQSPHTGFTYHFVPAP